MQVLSRGFLLYLLHPIWPDLPFHIRLKDALRPRPHVSGDFCIRKCFYADTKISASTRSVYESYTTVHTYPIRIRTSQRISQRSMRKKTGSDTVTSAYTKIYGYERPHVSGYTAYTEISGYNELPTFFALKHLPTNPRLRFKPGKVFLTVTFSI